MFFIFSKIGSVQRPVCSNLEHFFLNVREKRHCELMQVFLCQCFCCEYTDGFPVKANVTHRAPLFMRVHTEMEKRAGLIPLSLSEVSAFVEPANTKEKLF